MYSITARRIISGLVLKYLKEADLVMNARYATALPGSSQVVLTRFWLRSRATALRLPIHRLVVLAVLGGPLFGLIAVAGHQFAPLSYGLLFAPVAVFVSGTLLGMLALKEKVAAQRPVNRPKLTCYGR